MGIQKRLQRQRRPSERANGRTQERPVQTLSEVEMRTVLEWPSQPLARRLSSPSEAGLERGEVRWLVKVDLLCRPGIIRYQTSGTVWERWP